MKKEQHKGNAVTSSSIQGGSRALCSWVACRHVWKWFMKSGGSSNIVARLGVCGASVNCWFFAYVEAAYPYLELKPLSKRFHVLTAVTVRFTVFGDVTSSSLVDVWEIHLVLHNQGANHDSSTLTMKAASSLKSRYKIFHNARGHIRKVNNHTYI